jgi:hypothetical protein
MLVATHRPHKLSFTKNPIVWRFITNNLTDAGLRIEVKLVMYNEVGSPFKEYIVSAKPDAAGAATFALEDIIDSMIEYKYPAAGTITKSESIKRVNLFYRRITNAAPNPDFSILPEETDLYVIKGGIENFYWDYNNYFINWHTPNKPWATWFPQNRFVAIDDEFYISLLFVNDFASPDLDPRHIRTIAEFTDGTTATVDTPFVYEGLYLMYNIKANAKALGITAIVAAGRTLYRYKMQVVNTSVPSIVYSDVYTFYIDYRMFYSTRLFHYYNSLGGLDYVRVLGDAEEGYNRSFSDVEKMAGSVEVGSAADTQYMQTAITRYNSFKSDVGYRHTSAEIVALQELLNSGFIWQVFAHGNRRVWLTNKANRLLQNSDTKFNFPLEWRYGFTEVVFTPPAAALGVGVDSNTYVSCPVTANLVAAFQTYGSGGTIAFYDMSWDVVGAATSYTMEYKKSTDTAWTVVTGITTVPYGLNVPAGFTYNWRVKSVCGVGYESNYVNGTDFTN